MKKIPIDMPKPFGRKVCFQYKIKMSFMQDQIIKLKHRPVARFAVHWVDAGYGERSLGRGCYGRLGPRMAEPRRKGECRHMTANSTGAV